MKWLFVLSLVFTSLTFSSCSSDDNDIQGLTITVLPEFAYILPGTMNSCSDAYTDGVDSVAESRVVFGNVQVLWENTSMDLQLIAIQLEATHPNLNGGDKISFVLDDEEIDALLGTINGFTGTGSSGLKFSSKDSASPIGGVKTQSCSLRFGGLSVDDNAGKFTASARIYFIGVAINASDENDQKPFRITFPVTLRNEF